MSRFLIWYVVRVLVLRRLTQIVTTSVLYNVTVTCTVQYVVHQTTNNTLTKRNHDSGLAQPYCIPTVRVLYTYT